MTPENIAIHLQGASKSYRLYTNPLIDRIRERFCRGKEKYHTVFEAIKPVDLIINKGETVGILGHNGAGKSTLLKLISGVKQPSTGKICVNGKLVALLELGAGFNPQFTGIENIYFNCSLLGLNRAETELLVPEIIEFAEIGDFINQPVRLYSSGMYARLAFAVSVAISPDILVIDEILAVGDVLFQRKCFAKMEEFFKSGKTVIFVSHDIDHVRSLCERALLFHEGEMILDGPPQTVSLAYLELMFTPEKDKPSLVEKIKEFNKDHDQKQKLANKPSYQDLSEKVKHVVEANDGSQQLDYYIEGFASKSIKIEQQKDISFENYFLESMDGRKVTHLNSGSRYRLIFHVDFRESIRLVSFTAWMYSARTKTIGGFTLPGEKQSLSIVEKGDRYRLEVEFVCNLNRGLYGLRFVVNGEMHHSIVPISSITDAILFQVLDQADEINQGFVKFVERWELKKI